MRRVRVRFGVRRYRAPAVGILPASMLVADACGEMPCRLFDQFQAAIPSKPSVDDRASNNTRDITSPPELRSAALAPENANENER